MGVRVQAGSKEGFSGEVHFAYGTGWHVDDHGRLHVRGEGGNIATFHADRWEHAMDTTPTETELRKPTATIVNASREELDRLTVTDL